MMIQRNKVQAILFNFLFLTALIGEFGTRVHGQSTPSTKAYKQVVVDVLSMGIMYQRQLNPRFSMNFHLSAGPHYPTYSKGENKISFLPYALAELRFFPLHKAGKPQKFGFKPVDGLYVNFVGGMNLHHPEKINQSYYRSILPTPVAALGLGYQARFLKYGFFNTSFEYGLMQEQWYGSFGYHKTTIYALDPQLILGLGFSIPW